jgi:hypothetical protein
MCSGEGTRALPRVGFPIRRSRDQRSVSTSPGLIAAAHVLHRLLAPRHPPCALVLLIEKNTCCVAMEFSRCARNGCARTRRPPRGRSLKTQQRTFQDGRTGKACTASRRHRKRRRAEVDVLLGEPAAWTDKAHRARLKSGTDTKSIDRTGASGVRAPASLERR